MINKQNEIKYTEIIETLKKGGMTYTMKINTVYIALFCERGKDQTIFSAHLFGEQNKNSIIQNKIREFNTLDAKAFISSVVDAAKTIHESCKASAFTTITAMSGISA